jgi:lipopolysaccharide/colanic/teichoic acid biosynthesis glycosyltransferase
MALVVALPVIAIITVSIYLLDGGPVLFVQERVGLHGRPFRLLKFRSMRVEKNTSSEWERDNADRITPLGRWLRKLHLDELPQFWNILIGDMDLIGPRPHPVSNYELFARSIPYYSLRSLVRPGLTGWAQVRQGYAHDLPSEIEKMRYDLCAIARPSLLRDLWVLVTTARTVLVGRSPLEAVGKTDCGDVSPPYGARRVFSLQALGKRREPDLPPYPDQSMVTVSSENRSVRWRRPARLVAAVVLLFIVAELLRLTTPTSINTSPTPTVAAAAIVSGPPEPTSPTIAAVTAESDLASLDAAEATARAAVERYETSNSTVLRSIRAKRIGAESFGDGAKPQYEAEVRVEIPRDIGKPIRRSYFLRLQYVGSGEWDIERAMFATRY